MAKEPENKDGLALLANLELIEGNTDLALESIDKALAISPDEDRLYSIKGRILAVKKEYDGAESAFTKALEMNGQKQGNYVTLVSFYMSQKQFDKAEKVLGDMAAAFPE